MIKNHFLRIIILGMALQATQLCCIKLVTLSLNTTIGGLFLKPFATILPLMLAAAGSAVAIYWAGSHFLERRHMQELSPDLAATALLRGSVAACVLSAAVIAALWASGSATYIAFNGIDKAPTAALIFAAGVVFEELIFRGVILRVGEERLGTTPALIVSALLFSASHLGNNGLTVIGVFALFTGGILLGLTYVVSRNLWLPMGTHFGWNFALGALFGVSVSGHEAHGVFSFELSGPAWLSGGRFGPESSVFTLVFLILSTALFWRYATRHSDWRAHRLRPRVLPLRARENI